MVIRFLLILLISLVVTLNVRSQPESADPSKCYAKCMLEDHYEYEYEDYIVFTGDETTDGVKLEQIQVVLVEAGTRWVKKKADRECLSKDPNDCMVWCLTKVEEEIIELTTLLDTFTSKDFKIETIEFEFFIRSGGTEWREVVCADDVTDDLIKKIKLSLKKLGYNTILQKLTYDDNLKFELTQFQKDNYLPIGNLDFETLKALGVLY